MSLEQEYEQRKVILDAVAIEVRRLVGKIDGVELDAGQQEVTITAAGADWHVMVRYSRQSGFVHVSGHPYREDAHAMSILDVFGGGRDQLDFDFNCPVDWVPKSVLD